MSNDIHPIPERIDPDLFDNIERLPEQHIQTTDIVSPLQIHVDLSDVEDIPTSTDPKNFPRFAPSKFLQFLIIGVVIAGIAVSIATPLSIFLPRSTEPTEHVTTTTTTTETTTTTTTETTTTTSITTTTTTTSTTSTSTTSTTTTSSTSTTSSTGSTSSTSSARSTTTRSSARSTTRTTSSTTTRTTSSTTTRTTSTTTTTATTSTFSTPSFWSFDNTTADSLSIYHGILVNNPRYFTPGIDGYGAALFINRTLNQFVNVPVYRSFTNRSFTISLWFYWTGSSSHSFGIFGQCQSATRDRSLHLQIRSYSLYFGFFNDDLMGLSTVPSHIWNHAAFVYDFPTSTQRVYLNGVLDGIRVSSPYQGTSGDIVIGKTEQNPGSPSFFSGYLDEVSVVMRSKNATEILDEATLVTWNSFDNGLFVDSGPLNLLVTAVNITSIIGRVNHGIRFHSNSSYYQLNGFVELSVSNNPFSISLWVRPSTTIGSTLVRLASSRMTTNQNWCVDLMGFSSTGQIIITGWGSLNRQVIGPILPANSWTHVVSTYSLFNGYRLYVNGTFINTTGPMTYLASGQVNILTLGNSLQSTSSTSARTCFSQSIVPNVYIGSIDEFRVYSRELTPTDVSILANP